MTPMTGRTDSEGATLAFGEKNFKNKNILNGRNN
jgi:hypothetical protein